MWFCNIYYLLFNSAKLFSVFRFFSLTKIKITAFTGRACDQLNFALEINVFENKKFAKYFAIEKNTMQCHLDYST